MKLTKVFLLISMLVCLMNINIILCSSRLKHKSSSNRTKNFKKLFEDCTKSDECGTDLICAQDAGKEVKQCDEKKNCKESKNRV